MIERGVPMKDSHDKKLKDPIYGYISVPIEYVNKIIDTAPFQRLRRVIQTSFAPLYSSAVHNRFVHSMGVFHLGEMARKQLIKEWQTSDILKEKINNKKIQRLGKIFSLACLLHDVGHAPFSHTGESFYLHSESGSNQNVERYSNIHSLLIDEVGSKTFSSDVRRRTSYAAPHEIVSAYVGLKEYGEFFQQKQDREFFARCITGYLYSDKTKSLENCFISILNSNMIDVDKLDYLVRDAYITGFDTVRIDYERLLNSITLYYDEKENLFKIAYYKSAISIIENVIYAHDAEKKWIQTHPIVLYDGYLLNHIIQELNSKFDKELFSVKAISREGDIYSDKTGRQVHIRLLCDDDIIFLSKSLLNDSLVDEYFERNTRRHPLWKSEAEYNAYIKGELEGPTLDKVKNAIKIMLDSLEGKKVYVINEDYISEIENEINLLEDKEKILDKETYEAQISGKSKILCLCRGLKKFAEENNITPDFVFLKTSQFNSGFGKADFSDISIVFNKNGTRILKKFKEVIPTLNFSNDKKDYYYIYSKEAHKISGTDKNIYSYLLKELL